MRLSREEDYYYYNTIKDEVVFNLYVTFISFCTYILRKVYNYHTCMLMMDNLANRMFKLCFKTNDELGRFKLLSIRKGLFQMYELVK